MEYCITARLSCVHLGSVTVGIGHTCRQSRKRSIRKGGMILKEWSEAQDIYKAASARWRRAVKTVMARHKVRSYWYVWAAFLFFILSVASVALYPIPAKVNPQWWTGLSLWLTATLAALCSFGATEKALAKEFAADYDDHGISHYPFLGRRTYFKYVLFLDELKHRKYSCKQVEKLSEFAEIATPPAVSQFRLTQNPLFTYSHGSSDGSDRKCHTRLSSMERWNKSNYPEPWHHTFDVCYWRSLLLWHPIANRAKDKHQIIQRYLKWAERDLKEEQTF